MNSKVYFTKGTLAHHLTYLVKIRSGNWGVISFLESKFGFARKLQSFTGAWTKIRVTHCWFLCLHPFFYWFQTIKVGIWWFEVLRWIILQLDIIGRFSTWLPPNLCCTLIIVLIFNNHFRLSFLRTGLDVVLGRLRGFCCLLRLHTTDCTLFLINRDLMWILPLMLATLQSNLSMRVNDYVLLLLDCCLRDIKLLPVT